MAISDTAAEIGGNTWGHKTKQFFGGQKTLAGSISFFITAFLICFIWLNVVTLYPAAEAIKISLIISISTAIAETITLHGWDNLSVPAVATVVLYCFLSF